ncbi:MAG: PAS domain S-box protein [Burkholderiales bacterium]|nr:PAS domain S-box protein [Burkholderiales bacterium]
MSSFGEWSLETLRVRAEARAKAAPNHGLAHTQDLSPENLRALVHELQVHQIELEMQNDQLRQTQASLDATRSRYFDLYDLAPIGYCTVSELGLILETNFTAASMMAAARSDLVGKPLSRFIVKADQDTYYRCRKTLFEHGSPQECELKMLKRSGSAFWVQMRVSAAQDPSGAPVQRMVMTDISQRKHLDELLLANNQELEVARAVADRANQAKSDFLSNMTHELRSPLNAILGFAQLIDMGAPPPTASQKTNVDQILRAGWYLLDLIGEVLDLDVHRVRQADPGHETHAAGRVAGGLPGLDGGPGEQEKYPHGVPHGPAWTGRPRRPHAAQTSFGQPAVQRHQIQPPGRDREGDLYPTPGSAPAHPGAGFRGRPVGRKAGPAVSTL